MIAHLDGVVATVAPEGAVIDVGGVGLLVQCSPGTLAGMRPRERAKVCTSLVVRENALTLYGFASEDERGIRADAVRGRGGAEGGAREAGHVQP
jgi:Holliday junction DNA helicase RuvA